MSKYGAVQLNKLIIQTLVTKSCRDFHSKASFVHIFPKTYKSGLVFGNSCFISRRKVVKSWSVSEENLIHLEFFSRINRNKKSSARLASNY